jgi:hypothetical protein
MHSMKETAGCYIHLSFYDKYHMLFDNGHIFKLYMFEKEISQDVTRGTEMTVVSICCP